LFSLVGDLLPIAFCGSECISAVLKSSAHRVAFATDEGVAIADLMQEVRDPFKGMRSRLSGLAIKELTGFLEQHLDYHGELPRFGKSS
jgi:hypothetical protein